MGHVAGRPRLGVVYQPGSVDPLHLAAALAGDIEVVWVIERAVRAGLRPLEPLLRRLGPVVEVVRGTAARDLGAHGIGGVVSFADDIPLAAEVAAGLGLPFHRPAVAERLADKVAQRAALADAGLAGPAWWAVPEAAADQAALARQLPFPVVLKPRAGIGSRSTYRVETAADFVRLVSGSPAGSWIAEEMLRPRPAAPGTAALVMVESLVLGGVATHLVVRGQLPLAPPFRVAGSFLPAALDTPLRLEVEALTTAALGALGVADGFCNTGVILTSGGPRLIEVNGRLGGQLATLWEMAGGTSLLRAAADVALGGVPAADRLGLPAGAVPFAWYLQPPVGANRLKALEGVEEALAVPAVGRVVHHRRPGEPVDWREGNTSRVLTLLGVAADHPAMHEAIRCVEEVIRPTWGRSVGAHPATVT